MLMQKKFSLLYFAVSILIISNFIFIFNGFLRPVSTNADSLRLDEQEATVRAIKSVIPAVVSLTIYDYQVSTVYNINTGIKEKRNERREVGAGTGFLISSDGLILTNKHVANAAKTKDAEYQVTLNSGKKYYAQLIGKDPLSDQAIFKIFDKNLPFVKLGDSSKLELGKTVIAIGYSLGRYPNSVTKGVVSGLGRDIVASDKDGKDESLSGVIQTDAEINVGNSGGPLIDLNGNVVGINVATDKEGSSIGFAIPINDAKPVINTSKEIGRIVRPRLGVQYIMINPEIYQQQGLTRTNGALVTGEGNKSGVVQNSPAAKALIQDGDIIFNLNNVELNEKNTLMGVLQNYRPRDKVTLKIQRDKQILVKIIELDEFK